MTRIFLAAFAAAALALTGSGAAASTFTFSESDVNFTQTTDGPMLGPDGSGGGQTDQGAFGPGDTLRLIGTVNASNDSVRFHFVSPFTVSLTVLVNDELDFAQLFEVNADNSVTSVARQEDIGIVDDFAGDPPLALFNAQVFDAGTYALRFNGDDGGANSTYVAEVAAVPLPAPALLLVGALSAFGVLRRRA